MKLKHFLLTALILFCGVGGVYATRHYVRFTSAPSGATNYADLATVLNTVAHSGDTVLVATGLYIADNDEFTVPAGVTLIGGYAKSDVGATTRQYPGQFIPFSSSIVDTTQFTVLDGNSYKRTLASQKHRVVTVNTGGVVDGCLIRNGHARNKNGGGVLLNGGKLYNSIVRGNVAMSHPDSAEALGGGVFIRGNGELINCLVAYNMANDGYGVAAGDGGGKMINNTVTANTYSPVFSKIPKITDFQLYKSPNGGAFRPSDDKIEKWTDANRRITLNEFYISRTPTTQGQYAVFCAAIDITTSGTGTIYGQLNIATLKGLREPVKDAGDLGTRYGFTTTNSQNILQHNTNIAEPGLRLDDGVWHPAGDTLSVEYPMGYVSWFGSLAYAVWLGGGLPSRAQWQFAARCNLDGTASDNLFSGAYGTKSTTPLDTWRILDTIAWVDASVSIDTVDNNLDASDHWTTRPHEVARKRPNAMGIYDMTGNIYEWTADWLYLEEEFPYGTSPAADPIKTNQGENRVCLGGGYNATNATFFALTGFYYMGPAVTVVTAAKVAVGVRPIVAF